MQCNYSQQEMIVELRRYGGNHGFAGLGTAVVIVGPCAPFSVYSTWFAASDLEKAVQAGILERRKLSGSFTLDTYALATMKTPSSEM